MYLVFDIGGTKMRIATASGNEVGEPRIIPTPSGFEEGLQQIRAIAGELAPGEIIQGIAGGIAGPLNPEKTMLVKSPHVGNWVNQPLKQKLQEMFNCPVFLENDADLGGLGEATHGAGQHHNIVAFFTISTGVGGARIVDQKIDRNSLGFEPGHQIIVPNGNQCECGGQGHLESYVGGLYLQRIYGLKGIEITDPKTWDQIAHFLALGLTNSVVHWSPDIIVLGGSVSNSLPIETVQNYLQEYLTIFPKGPQVVKGTLGDKAGLYGGLALLNTANEKG